MEIVDHKLDGVTQRPLPQLKRITPKLIIIHYTAGGSLNSSWNALDRSGLSAHLLIDRDGTIVQMGDFNRRTNHAGKSQWNSLSWLNNHSIGIEVCNYGWLPKQGDGVFKRTKAQGATPAFSADQVIVASHKNGWPKDFGWEIYPDVQLEAAEAVCRALVAAYSSITDIVGHDEVSPERKQDPGPAYPITDLRLLVDPQDPPGDAADEVGIIASGSGFADHIVTAVSGLNMRSAPAVGATVRDVLRHGQIVRCGPKSGDWVEVDQDLDSVADGFVHKSFVRAV